MRPFRRGHRRWLVATGLAAVIGIAGTTNAGAAGTAFANGTSNTCWEVDRGQALTTDKMFDTNWACAATVSTNITILPTNTSAGPVQLQASFAGTATCGLTTSSTATFTFSYEDSFGGFSFSGSIPYSSTDQNQCHTNYAGLTSCLQLSGQFGLYVNVSELNKFDMTGQYNSGSNTVGTGPAAGLVFDVDNGSSATCTPTN